MTMKWTFFLAIALACSSLCRAGDWKLIWSDEFNRPGLPDPTKWDYEEGFVRNEEQQYYTRSRPENARVEKGVLIIEGRKEKQPAVNPTYKPGAPPDDAGHSRKEIAYTSACLITKQKESFLFGRLEVRAKVPPGKGMWPGIWMVGIDREHLGWPANGEIDIMEFLGREPDAVHGTVHFAKDGKPAESGKELTKQNPTDGFHIYAIEWSTDEIRFFYDDQIYHTFAVKDAQDPTGNPFQRPQYLLINLALGGSWGGALDDAALPAQFQIDYVRFYRKGPTTQPAK